MTLEQLIVFRIFASAFVFLLTLGVAALWCMIGVDVYRHGISAISAFIAAATAVLTVAIAALAYLAAVIR